jgi:hypothetical protein
MSNDRQGGSINILLVPLILSVVLLIAAIAGGIWAYGERQDYKDNVEKKVATAVTSAKAQTQAADAIKYAEEAKNPLKTHVGLPAFGSVTVVYPKTWSGYVIETGKGNTPLSNYYHPDVVPGSGGAETDIAYALRIQIVEQPYDQVLNSFNSQVTGKKVTVAPYTLPKVPNTIGSRIDGQITQKKQGSMIILPLRNLTLQIWTESSTYMKDFDEIILPNISFQP